MAPKILKSIGRGFRNMCCMKTEEDFQSNPAYGAEISDQNEILHETTQPPPPKQELNKSEDTAYETCLSDWDILSSKSSEYFTCDESVIGSLMSYSECDAVEYKLNRIIVGLEIFKRRLQLFKTETMQSEADRFQQKLLETESILQKMEFAKQQEIYLK